MSTILHEKDFAGIAKTIVRTFCPWPDWKVFWEVKTSGIYRYFFGQRQRTFDLLAISKRTGHLITFEVKRNPSYAVKSIEAQVALDSQYSDKLYVLAAERLIIKLDKHLPHYVGLVSIPTGKAGRTKEEIKKYQVVRRAKRNKSIDPFLKLMLLIDLDLTIQTWHDRVARAIEIQESKVGEEEIARRVKELVPPEECQLIFGWRKPLKERLANIPSRTR